MVGDFEDHQKWVEFVLLVKMLFKVGWMDGVCVVGENGLCLWVYTAKSCCSV